jgi:RHS repeat-associated protein
MLLAFALPILLGAFSLRRRLPAPDRLLTCFRLPLFLRGTASLVAFTMLLTSLPFNTLAQEADLYTQLETSNWGRGGTVTQYEYDDNGSLTRKTVTGAGESLVEAYTYDLQNRLASHVRTDSDEIGTAVTTTAYRYSPAGGKVGQATTVVMNGVLRPELSETTNYLLDFSNPTGYAQTIEETDGAGTLLKSYTIGDDVLSQSVRTATADAPLTSDLRPLTSAYFLYDGHGSTRQLANAQGSVTAQYAYDAYGVMLGQTSGAQQRQATSLLYSGEQFDSTLQQYHLRARNYNQANGQFTTLDPYAGNIYDPQSLHKYAYCHTDPVNGVDPSGLNYTLSGTMAASSIAASVAGLSQYFYARNVLHASAWDSITSSLCAAAMAFLAVYYAPAILAAITATIAYGGMFGGLLVSALIASGVSSLSLEIKGLGAQALSDEYTPIQKVIIASKILSIILTGVLAGVSIRNAGNPSLGAIIESPQGRVRVGVEAGRAGSLTYDAATKNWTSAGGLVYGPGSVHGNRVLHVLDHLSPNAGKPAHTLFKVQRNELLGLLDNAWAKRGSYTSHTSGNWNYRIDMGRVIGYGGETAVNISVRPGTSEIMTAFPIL